MHDHQHEPKADDEQRVDETADEGFAPSNPAIIALPLAIDLPEEKKKKRTRLPALRSGDQTLLPGITPFQAITQSFFPGIEKQYSLWIEEGIGIVTPAGVLTIQGDTSAEQQTLHDYVERQLGPSGLKYLLAFYDVYVYLTGGSAPEKNVEVTARQLLTRLGKGTHASDRDEQLLLKETAKYLSRIWVSSSPRAATSKRSAPLLVVESIVEHDTDITFRYHLGVEFYLAVFGPKPQRYVFPTYKALSYNGKHQGPEIQLSFHLSAQLALGKGSYSVYFVNLCLQAPVMTLTEIQFGGNRTRTALRLLFALEQLEKDGVVMREAHEQVDMALAASVLLDPKTEKKVAPTTLKRLSTKLTDLKRRREKDGEAALVALRRIALQTLLDIDTADEQVLYPDRPKLIFLEGPLLQEQRAQSAKKGMQAHFND